MNHSRKKIPSYHNTSFCECPHSFFLELFLPQNMSTVSPLSSDREKEEEYCGRKEKKKSLSRFEEEYSNYHFEYTCPAQGEEKRGTLVQKLCLPGVSN